MNFSSHMLNNFSYNPLEAKYIFPKYIFEIHFKYMAALNRHKQASKTTPFLEHK